MAVGGASALRLIAAVFHLRSESLLALSGFVAQLGDPEISTGCALVCVGLLFTGRPGKALGAFLFFGAGELFWQEQETPRVISEAERY